MGKEFNNDSAQEPAKQEASQDPADSRGAKNKKKARMGPVRIVIFVLFLGIFLVSAGMTTDGAPRSATPNLKHFPYGIFH